MDVLGAEDDRRGIGPDILQVRVREAVAVVNAPLLEERMADIDAPAYGVPGIVAYSDRKSVV